MGGGRLAWERTIAIALAAETLGFGSLWVFDHFMTVSGPRDELTPSHLPSWPHWRLSPGVRSLAEDARAAGVALSVPSADTP